MSLFYYTEVSKVQHEDELDLTVKTGYSFNLEDVVLTYPEGNNLYVVLAVHADKMNPVEYQYKIDPKTKQKVPVKVSKFEITSEPISILLTVKDEINKFFELTGGPNW